MKYLPFILDMGYFLLAHNIQKMFIMFALRKKIDIINRIYE